MNTIYFNETEAKTLTNKLEYRFKKSETGQELISKLLEKKEMNSEEAKTLANKLEYNFKNSNHELVTRLKEFVNLSQVDIME